MNNKQIIQTNEAPQPIGAYSQAVRVGDTVYLSGQIALDATGNFLEGGIEVQTRQVFKNLAAVALAAGGQLNQCVKLTIFLSDLTDFPVVNSIMAEHFTAPYPARSTIEVSALPKGARVEIEAIIVF
ncbi:Rid family detoxifying hydrolase [Rickettsiella endosymbiont of Dermanyssus gallinae]|uniref:Rid family detoxifying hydrolase n=1 Tax=Rickettsiella endosymbiont of Dermanyssus gallinae TaxID=2856608 RepID=UPI001C5336C5|nr:Rid family detoxifying hydrolase [Rickettsiella endosymbiont of Dermanyssus gallinae]